jgi:molybdate/tungstate transport system substrate-binding protein
VACSSNNKKSDVTVFYAASLSRVMAEIEEDFEKINPQIDLLLEPSGSQIAARKVSELGRQADLVVTADWRVIDEILLPKHARWLIQFAANEMVLAHAEHSRYTEEIAGDNWHKVLLRPKVRLGRADENTAPLGFHTLLVWKLQQQKGQKDLTAKLKNRCSPEHVTADISELVSLLESRAIDYAFVFRSIAEEHNLKVTRLADDINLSSPAKSRTYAQAQVGVLFKSGSQKKTISGAPIVYGLTIPIAAANEKGAIKLVDYLLAEPGRRTLQRAGFKPVHPPKKLGTGNLPN